MCEPKDDSSKQRHSIRKLSQYRLLLFLLFPLLSLFPSLSLSHALLSYKQGAVTLFSSDRKFIICANQQKRREKILGARTVFALSSLSSVFVLAEANNYPNYLKTEALNHLVLTSEEDAGIKHDAA